VANHQIEAFKDTAFIYHSEEDGCWIAHSLHTDQVGTGVDMGRALADLVRGIDQLMELAQEDETIAYRREAPAEIQERAASSKRLPKEIFEVAHKIARGQWPAEIEPSFQAQDDDEEFVTDVCQPVA
jgi:hypothetical protein